MIVQLKVPGLACDACAKTITQAVLTVDSTASVKADSKTKQVTVETQASEISVRKAITSVGYNPT